MACYCSNLYNHQERKKSICVERLDERKGYITMAIHNPINSKYLQVQTSIIMVKKIFNKAK